MKNGYRWGWAALVTALWLVAGLCLIQAASAQTDCGCDGGLTELQLRYDGTGSADITVEVAGTGGGGTTIVIGNVDDGNTFTIESDQGAGEKFSSNDITILIGGVPAAIFHVSCSADIIPFFTNEGNDSKGKHEDLDAGSEFTVLAAVSKKGGPVVCTGGVPRQSLLGEGFEVAEVPGAFTLGQNYPNPFNPETRIRFGLPEAAQVKLVVYDVLGRQVKVLANGTYQPGQYEVTFDASTLASGTYLVRLVTPAGSFVETMQLMK